MTRNKRILWTAAFAVLAVAGAAALALKHSLPDKSTPKGTLESFYREYLDYRSTSGTPAPELPFSSAFKAAQAEDKKICDELAGTDICGFGADENIYLNTQESDPALTYKNSHITFTELTPTNIKVTLNVYPTATDSVDYYTRTVTYMMVQENGTWAVDDMIVGKDGSSARELMHDEITALKTYHESHPSDQSED